MPAALRYRVACSIRDAAAAAHVVTWFGLVCGKWWVGTGGIHEKQQLPVVGSARQSLSSSYVRIASTYVYD